MIVSVPKETAAGETRVALTPDAAKKLAAQEGVTVRLETGAGVAASFPDDAYREAGCEVTDRSQVLAGDIILSIDPPVGDELRAGAVTIGLFYPLSNHDVVRSLAARKVTSFSLDLMPRITRAQSMDVLSSMSTVSGYKAVLLAATSLGKFFPMLITAAGTIAPARALILGAGVAGLQAIATARRLGAVVEAFDVRPAAKEQVESLGARFLAVDAGDLTAEGEGGYAKEMSEEQHKRELKLLHEHIVDADIVVTTALIPGRPAPLLITEEMVKDMKPGSVIVDLAAEMGGNCACTEKGQDVVKHDVMIIGQTNIPASMPVHASQMYARNLTTFLALMNDNGAVKLDFDDEIISGTCVTRDGEIVHDRVKQAVGGGAA